jgi:hypothetical protein
VLKVRSCNSDDSKQKFEWVTQGVSSDGKLEGNIKVYDKDLCLERVTDSQVSLTLQLVVLLFSLNQSIVSRIMNFWP